MIDHENYIGSWNGSNKARIATELASIKLENQRIPDPYDFLIDLKTSKLKDLFTNRNIEDFIDTTGYLGEIENIAFQKIQNWAVDTQSGVCLWISPPFYGVYPTSKIIVSEIVETSENKRLTNRAIILDWNAQEVYSKSMNLYFLQENGQPTPKDIEEIRAKPIFIQPDNYERLSQFLNYYLTTVTLEYIESGEDIKRQKELFDKYYGSINANGLSETQILQLVDVMASSCPPSLMRNRMTAFRVMGGEGKFVQGCGNCGVAIMKWIPAGYVCKCCFGVYEGC